MLMLLLLALDCVATSPEPSLSQTSLWRRPLRSSDTEETLANWENDLLTNQSKWFSVETLAYGNALLEDLVALGKTLYQKHEAGWRKRQDYADLGQSVRSSCEPGVWDEVDKATSWMTGKKAALLQQLNALAYIEMWGNCFTVANKLANDLAAAVIAGDGASDVQKQSLQILHDVIAAAVFGATGLKRDKVISINIKVLEDVKVNASTIQLALGIGSDEYARLRPEIIRGDDVLQLAIASGSKRSIGVRKRVVISQECYHVAEDTAHAILTLVPGAGPIYNLATSSVYHIIGCETVAQSRLNHFAFGLVVATATGKIHPAVAAGIVAITAVAVAYDYLPW